MAAAPDVPTDHVLWLVDRDTPDLALGDVSFTWLKSVGLDRSTPYRGMAVVPSATDEGLAHGAGVAIYKPFTP